MPARHIKVTPNYLEIDEKPVFIFGGDLSYCRVPRRSWKERMLQMKAAGLNTITVYLVWEYHQPEPGFFDFAGERDLSYFLSLIKECGMYCIYRMGPFVHGEFRNGGLPQWLIDKVGDRVRTNDPEYLHYAEAWYLELIKIVKPFLITNGGPVILLQLENELGSAGCKGDDLARGSADAKENKKHLLFYYDLVRSNGIDLPLLDINYIPDKEKIISPLVDTSGMYPVNCFCCDGDIQDYSVDWWQNHRHPQITIETGGGMFIRYYDTPPYRNTNGFQGPVVKPEIIEMTVNKHIAEGASGVNLYIFCDGQNPDGCGEGMLPVRNMNYQAPISTVGHFRDSYWKLKRIGWFLRSFGQELLKSSPEAHWAVAKANGIAHPGTFNGGDLFENYGKTKTEEDNTDSQIIPSLGRITAGLNLSESNFLFLRNTFNSGSEWKRDVRILTSPSNFACEVWQEYPKKTQLDLAPGTSKIMPFFIRLRKGHFLEYSTAELLDRRNFNGKTQVILCEADDIITETKLTIPGGQDFKTAGNVLLLHESPNSVTMIARPERHPILVETKELRILLVTKTYAEHLWDIGSETAWSNAVLSGRRDEIVCMTEQSDFAMEWMTPVKPELADGLKDPHEEYDAVRGIYRISGSFDLPKREIFWKRSVEGDDLILTAEISEELLSGLDDLIIAAHVDGSLANAYLDDVFVSDHAWGKFLPWEISIKDFPAGRGILKLVCHDALECRVAVFPKMKYFLHFS